MPPVLELQAPGDHAENLDAAINRVESASSELLGTKSLYLGAGAGALGTWAGDASDAFRIGHSQGGHALDAVRHAHQLFELHLREYHSEVVNAHNRCQQAHDHMQGALDHYANAAGSAAGSLLNNVGSAISSVESSIQHAAQNAFAGIVHVFSDVEHWAANHLPGLHQAVNAGREAEKHLSGWAPPNLSPILRPAIGPLAPPEVPSFDEIHNFMHSAGGFISDVVHDGISGLINAGHHLLNDGLNLLKQLANDVVNAIRTAHQWVHDALHKLADIGRKVAGALIGAVEAAIKFEWHLAEGVWNGSVAALSAMARTAIKADMAVFKAIHWAADEAIQGGKWVWEHRDQIAEITSEIAGDIATVATVLTFCLPPPADAVAATVALAAGAIKLGADAYLVSEGKKGWGDLAWDALGVATGGAGKILGSAAKAENLISDAAKSEQMAAQFTKEAAAADRAATAAAKGAAVKIGNKHIPAGVVSQADREAAEILHGRAAGALRTMSKKIADYDDMSATSRAIQKELALHGPGAVQVSETVDHIAHGIDGVTIVVHDRKEIVEKMSGLGHSAVHHAPVPEHTKESIDHVIDDIEKVGTKWTI